MTLKRQRGFSLLEMLIVIAIGLTLAGITTMAYVPVMKQQRVTTAYNETLTTIRRARDQAAADMRIYVVQFAQPGTITVTQVGPGVTTCQIPPSGPVLVTTVLPPDISFQIEPGSPTSPTVAPTTPDGFGAGLLPIDFDEPTTPGTASICFNPDGSASDTLGNVNSGVIYLGRTGDVYSGRAITLWGTTGRIRGFRLNNVSNVPTWSQQ